jgi:RHH-type rel operon transcriptional repressor/antitoxin RelB
MLAVRLDKETEKRLETLAKETKRSKSYYAKEAIKMYLEELEDLEIARARANDPADKLIGAKELRKRLGL